MKQIFILALLSLLAGCATPIVTYHPQGENITFNQGVGTLTATTPDLVLAMAPTFRYQRPQDLPTFTLSVTNTSKHDVDFDPALLQGYTDNQLCHVYSLEERVQEIRHDAVGKQVALAILGGIATGAVAYGASHGSVSTTVYGVSGRRPFVATATTTFYDPLSGILAGSAVAVSTGIGLQQIQEAAGHEEMAAQAIFQHTTIPPGTTVVGQVILRPTAPRYAQLRIDVPLNQGARSFVFNTQVEKYSGQY